MNIIQHEFNKEQHDKSIFNIHAKSFVKYAQNYYYEFSNKTIVYPINCNYWKSHRLYKIKKTSFFGI